MFESVDIDHNRSIDHPLGNRQPVGALSRNRPSEAVMLVLETGFRTRVMSYRSAHDLGARSDLSLAGLRARTEECAGFIRAGLGCAVDEVLFAALVHHFPDLARDLSHLGRDS